MNNFKTVKHSYPRHEALSKALGTAKYTDDISLPNMAYGVILRSPHAHAIVKTIDTKKAEALEGVFGVLTPKDVPNCLFNCSGNPPSAALQHDEVILTMHPMCLGDRIAAVVADSFETCQKAIRLIEIEYEVLEPNFKINNAIKEGSFELQPNVTEGHNMFKNMVFKQGDVDAGLKDADLVFEGDFTTQAVAHVALELTGCICDWAPDGKITIHSPSQTLYQERRILSEILGVPENTIRVIKPAMGSGFGARQQLHNQPVGVLLSKLARRPVKMMNTREEDMYASVTRHETQCNIKIGVSKDGVIETAKVENFLNGGPYTTHSVLVSAAAGRKFQYRAKNYLYEGKTIATNSPTAGAFRGYGNIQLVFGREVLVSRIAKALNMDPVEFRKKNHLKVGERFPAADYDLYSCEIEACVAKADGFKAEIDDKSPLINNDTISQAWGHAFCCHSTGPSNKDGMSSAVVMVNDDGSANLSIGSADIGQGSETVMKQITAEKFGLPYDMVTVKAADTDHTPYDTGTFASGQTYVCGNAVVRACDDAIDKLLAAVAVRYDIKKDEVTYNEGKFTFTANGENNSYSFNEAVKIISFGMKGFVIIGSASYKAQSSPPPFAVCYAKVQHDNRDNSITVLDVIEVVDVGTAINPMAVEGQIEGGIAQGIGYVFTENIEVDRVAKKTSSADLLHYKVPMTVDMPNIHVGIVESYEPTGPLGAKSVGELTIVPIAPAIVNAIEAATSQTINHIPVCDMFMPKSQGRQQI